jgi:hypothetical protein
VKNLKYLILLTYLLVYQKVAHKAHKKIIFSPLVYTYVMIGIYQSREIEMENKFMNPVTGSIDSWENWVQDQKEMGDEIFPVSDLEKLIEVEFKDGDWIEVG